MDRYQRVEKPREDTQINENEIRITTQGRMHSYITYATTLLQGKGSNEIVFKAMGRAINKTVMIVELIKRRIADLHQNTAIGSTDITDTWEPLEEGLLLLETTRHVSMITITLSKKEIDTASVGYQPPLPKDQVKPLVEFDYEGEGSPGGRGRGRGGRGRGRARGSALVHSKTIFLGHRIAQMGAVAGQEENQPRSLLQMTKPVDSIDVVVISSDSDGNLSDRERDDEEAKTNRKGNDEGKKGTGADVSPSFVQVKTEDDKKADDDCCILDFNPFESAATNLVNKLSLGNGNGDDQEEDDLSVLAEKGEVACRDFPHSRHQCAEFLFDNTPHESFCSQCYCYVCDTPAPCTQWKGSLLSHCHASDRLSMWKDLRSFRRKI